MKRSGLSLAIILLATSAMAQTLPEAEELAERVAGQLPPFWSVDEFRLTAQSDLGDAAQPRVVVRFEAEAAPSVPLFAPVEQRDPFVVVAPTHDEGHRRTLYGIIDLSFRAGVWTGDAEIENPVSGLGQPSDLFDRPVLVLGDPEADARIAQMREQREANAMAQFEQQLRLLRNEHEAALAQLQQDQDGALEATRRAHAAALAELRSEQAALEGGLEAEVAALRRTQAEELAAVTAEHAAEMRSLERRHGAALQAERDDHRAAMEALQRELQAELLALTEGLEPEVEAARQEHGRTLAELRRTQEAELEELRVTHARARGEMRERLREEIAAAELELASEVERLRGQLGRSEEAQALQAAYLESVRARSAAAVELERELETALARRVNLVQRLPQQYRGGVRCRDPQGRIDRSWQLSLQFAEINPSGMNGRFRVDGSNRTQANGTANLVLRGDEVSLPLQARLSLAGASDASHLPNTIDVVIGENMVIRGTETTTWTIDNARVEVSCAFEFS